MDDRSIENHPDLLDPEWRKHAEKEAWTEARRYRRPNYKRRVLWTFLGLVVLAAAGAGWYWLGPKPQNASDAAAPPAAPTTLAQFAKVDLAKPFANTPAVQWADSADALETPAATPVGSFTAQQVGDAIAKVKQVINLGHLDRRTLEGHDTASYLALLSPDERDHLRQLLAKPDKNEAGYYVTHIADGFRLLPAGPKINGKLTVRPGDQKGELVVHAAFVTAYAFHTDNPERLSGPGEIVAFHRLDLDYVLRDASEFAKRSVGLALGAGSGSTFSMACGPAKTGYLAPLYSESTRPAGPEPTTDEAAQYDINKPMPTEDTCGP
ncbi:hypothetical protein [Amycolatopsis anabasis]|uniref:hypothetical protein n=1 Tax=Amycolatopsis anabasis TaxID=1840409 RepID=UPI00131ADFF0|nr:hypothetical protein [Amycolatopsis anabasis]